MKGRILSKLWILALVLCTIAADQISKDWVRTNVEKRAYIPIAKDYLILTNVENTGAMLGFGQDFPPILKSILFQLLPILVLLVLLYRILTKKNLNKYLILAFALVIGGGIGNLIDRIAYGSVTDFYQVKLGIFKTGIFNVADMAVTAGVLILLFLVLRGRKLDF